MSDFDKEAEREKLREKYEQEEEKRKTTEQMSELLLKGATMTNAHCSDCGDPIFRYDGQEFCPTCQKPVDRGTDEDAPDADSEGRAADAAGDTPAQNGDAGPGGIEVTDPSDDASVQFGGSDADDETRGAVDQARDALADQADESDEAAAGQPPADPGELREVPSAAPSESPELTQSPEGTRPESTGGAAGESVGEHLDRAQVVLARTVERHAKLAASADSPRETRDHLETAREAARTLDATGY